MWDRIPFPQRGKKQKEEESFKRFAAHLKGMKVTISLEEALKEMPKYSKFLKDIIAGRRHIADDVEIQDCHVVHGHELPEKLCDPGVFTLPVHFDCMKPQKALCDLGSAINLMPKSLYDMLELGPLLPSNQVLRMADGSLKYPCGEAKDIILTVGKLLIPADFTILEMEHDKEIPLLLGRPFLATVQANINVGKGVIQLKVGEVEASYSINDVMKMMNEKDISEIEYIVAYTLDYTAVQVYNLERESENQGYVAKECEGSVAKSDLPQEQKANSELKILPSHLKYAFLTSGGAKPVIINTNLSRVQENL